MIRMMLLTKAIERALPPLYANEGKHPDDVPVLVKWFTPDSDHTWYVTEFDPQDRLVYCLVTTVHCPEGEFGYTSLDDVKALRGPFGLYVERDTSWDGGRHTLGDVLRKVGREVPARAAA